MYIHSVWSAIFVCVCGKMTEILYWTTTPDCQEVLINHYKPWRIAFKIQKKKSQKRVSLMIVAHVCRRSSVATCIGLSRIWVSVKCPMSAPWNHRDTSIVVLLLQRPHLARRMEGGQQEDGGRVRGKWLKGMHKRGKQSSIHPCHLSTQTQ